MHKHALAVSGNNRFLILLITLPATENACSDVTLMAATIREDQFPHQFIMQGNSLIPLLLKNIMERGVHLHLVEVV